MPSSPLERRSAQIICLMMRSVDSGLAAISCPSFTASGISSSGSTSLCTRPSSSASSAL